MNSLGISEDASILSAKPRLLAIDVDDTLLEADVTLSNQSIEAVAKAQSAGIHVMLATGRMYRSALPYARRLNMEGYLIVYNGALIRSVEGETLWHKPVPEKEAFRLVEIAREEDISLNLYIDDRLLVDERNEHIRAYEKVAGLEAEEVDLEAALEWGEPTKCLFVGDPKRVAAILPQIIQAFPGLQVARSKPHYIEMTRRGVTKGEALVAVAEAMDIPIESVVAIGDGENDADMIARAGLGVAVANASDGAKAAADLITSAPRGAGVSEVIHQHLI